MKYLEISRSNKLGLWLIVLGDILWCKQRCYVETYVRSRLLWRSCEGLLKSIGQFVNMLYDALVLNVNVGCYYIAPLAGLTDTSTHAFNTPWQADQPIE
jgi:hypothetical protein